MDMAGTVHGLDRVVPVLRGRGEHVVFVVLPVTRPLPQAAIEDLRAADLLIAGLYVDPPQVLLDLLPDGPALRMPEDLSGRVVL